MNNQQIVQTGSSNVIVNLDSEFKVVDRWLISYGWDDEIESFLWHEFRVMNEEFRYALGKKMTDAGIKWEMLNISALENHGDPWTIEQFIEMERERKAEKRE